MRKNGITTQAAAEILDISPQTLRNWDASGKLKAHRDENDRRVYFISELERFVTKHDMKRTTNARKLAQD